MPDATGYPIMLEVLNKIEFQLLYKPRAAASVLFLLKKNKLSRKAWISLIHSLE